MANIKQIYYAVLTDTIAGEVACEWVRLFKVHAKSQQGAICKLARHTGFKFRRDSASDSDTSGVTVYRAACAPFVAILSGYTDEAEHYANVVSL